MKETSFLTPCGLNCSDCEYYTGEKQPRCIGCNALKGKPFWGNCETYDCNTKNNTKHCGLCISFPCDNFTKHYDPNDPEGPKNTVTRIGLLAYRAQHGDEKTIELMKTTKS